MAQTSGLGQDESWGWPCPYCRAHNPVDSVTCANCSSQLRDPDDDDLFTTVAADNAEVVPPDAPFGRDNMWTTDANEVDDVGQGEVVDDGFAESGRSGPAAQVNGSAFSAEPARRPDDVIDEPFHVDEATVRSARRPGANGELFSNGSGPRASDARHDQPTANGAAGRSPFGAPGGGDPPDAERWPSHDGWSGPAQPWVTPGPTGYAPGPPSHQTGFAGAPNQAGFAGAPNQAGFAGAQRPGSWQFVESPPGQIQTQPTAVPDPHGLSAAVGRLRAEDQDRAAIPIAVCGALLRTDEVVLAAVTGQMLGHPAVVVLTTRRVLVVNGRRWQPIVDVFDVGPTLTVRGRHDRDVAALSFSDDSRLSTVDGIGEVGLAVELADRIRGE